MILSSALLAVHKLTFFVDRILLRGSSPLFKARVVKEVNDLGIVNSALEVDSNREAVLGEQ
jgi:hypothetical protein